MDPLNLFYNISGFEVIRAVPRGHIKGDVLREFTSLATPWSWVRAPGMCEHHDMDKLRLLSSHGTSCCLIGYTHCVLYVAPKK